MNAKAITLLGAGSWGTAVAIHLARVGHRVLLWARDPEHVAQMKTEQANNKYLAGHAFPKRLTVSDDLDQCLNEAEHLVIAVPSLSFAKVLGALKNPPPGLTWLTKGLDPKTHQLLSVLVAQRFGAHFPVAVLSGPSFAQEVAHSLPTALTLASNNLDYQRQIHSLFHQHPVRVYLSDDLIGVQLCGAVKNVLAIACGISDGLGYGANAKAALITRGLAEMSRLGLGLGAKADTFIGLSGVGDLVLTCTDDQSRNRRFGLLLGQKIDVAIAEQRIGQVVEGRHNAAQVCLLAQQFQIEMPICEQVHDLLLGQIGPNQAVDNLMRRPPREE